MWVLPLLLLIIFVFFLLVGYFSSPNTTDRKITESIMVTLKKDQQDSLFYFLIHWIRSKYNWRLFYVSVVVFLTLTPLLFLTLPYSIVDFDQLILLTIFVSLILVIIGYFRVKLKILNMLGYTFPIAIYTFLVLKAINIYADDTAPNVFIGNIVSMTTHTYMVKATNYTSYVIEVVSSDEKNRVINVRVDLFSSLKKNSRIKVSEKEGAFGIRWIKNIENLT